MEQTLSQHLPYPVENDPGDGALQLQVLAEAIDAKLVAAFAAYREVVNPPTAVVNLSANQTGIVNSTETQILFDQDLYIMGDWALTPSWLFFPETGYYRVGTYINSLVAGAVTAQSSVQVYLFAPYVSSLPLATYTREVFTNQDFQPATATNIHQVVETLVRCDVVNTTPSNVEPTDYSGILASIWHANTASAIDVIAGSKMWAYKVSELEGF